jgi:dienelactone hydrolase
MKTVGRGSGSLSVTSRAGRIAICVALLGLGACSSSDSSAGSQSSTTRTTASAADGAALDCTGLLGNPVSGSAGWNEADRNNQQCAAEGLRILQENPAVAAAKTANADAGEGGFVGDPFRAPRRWAGKRGRYQQTTYTDRDGKTWPAALFGPRDAGGGPYPGVLVVCHACFPLPQTTENVGLWYWAAESLAEAGYVVLYATVGGNSVSRTIDATDFFMATPASPTSGGEFNPWYMQLDRNRLGIVGHSGAAGVALDVGNSDRRYDAIVAWDPAASYTFTGVTPRIPTMIQVADYTLRDGPVPRAEKPMPAPGSKYTFFDTIRTAGVDVMEVAPRASTHLDWTHFAASNPFGPSIDHGVYGEMVATYYTLAWLDRYVAPLRAAPSGKVERQSKAKAKEALRRLTASGTDRFDRSADVHSIGSGFFDADKAKKARNPEAGNVPITIGGLPIGNLLSFEYDSRYFLNGGGLHCQNMRAGCR